MSGRKTLLPFLVLLAVLTACSRFSGNTGADLIFPATEVGVPNGEMISKEIGAAGGSFSSPDGRITLKVPQGALSETITFTIQPITNKGQDGAGVAYRFGPDGKTFNTPLEIALKYDESDLSGTIPEALLLAFQNKQGEWQQLKPKKFDPAHNTITVETTHFTDVGALAGFRIHPAQATVYVGKTRGIQFLKCRDLTFMERIRGFHWRQACAQYKKIDWDLRGPGNLDPAFGMGEGGSTPGYLYTAPAKKPADNKAYIDVMIELEVQDPTTGLVSVTAGKFTSIITIIDRGYRASGQDGPTTYSGVICDLGKPFTVLGHNGPLLYTDKFTPSSDSGGSATLSASLSGVVWAGNGPYTVVGLDTARPQIVWQVTTTACGGPCGSGSAPAHIDLIPLEANEGGCGG